MPIPRVCPCLRACPARPSRPVPQNTGAPGAVGTTPEPVLSPPGAIAPPAQILARRCGSCCTLAATQLYSAMPAVTPRKRKPNEQLHLPVLKCVADTRVRSVCFDVNWVLCCHLYVKKDEYFVQNTIYFFRELFTMEVFRHP
jgi:hypothetical protein